MPAKYSEEPRPTAKTSVAIARAPSIIRIARPLGRPARVSHAPVEGRPDLLGVFPQIARRELHVARFPSSLPPREFLVRKPAVVRAGFRAELTEGSLARQP